MDNPNDIENIKKYLSEKLETVSSVDDISKIRNEFLGKKGFIGKMLSDMRNISSDQRKDYGAKLNLLKIEVENMIDEYSGKFENDKDSIYTELYKSLPGRKPEIGHINIITQAISEITKVFAPLGFNRVRYPEIDREYYVFEALNMPETHPARDEWETFFVDSPNDEKLGRLVITPHTSSGQVREMLKGELPIRMLNISRCGRRQIDVSHVPSFYQFEGLVIDENISTTHLIGVLDYFAKNFFGADRETRLRPYHFRFTEPSFEVDINCGICHGKGCKLCKGGWLELGGAGMVHPNVLKAGGVDTEKYSGFAFGWGVERTYMMKSGTKIDDIRNLFSNDLRFLEQF
ncbi:phenylalanine--tRNA ligase subunit alpha [Patescibacteria group bacterium]|nr:phenylalanine--tRNA ligase subunit alpha [Patescibacteria group bacterium]